MADEKTQARSFSVRAHEGSYHTVKADNFSTTAEGTATFFLDNRVIAIFRDFKVLREEGME